MFNLEYAISRWRQQMAAGGIKDHDVLNELESHLRDEVDEQVRSGMSVEPAFEAATHRMGQATVLRAEFEKADQAKRVRVRKNLLGVFVVTMGVFITSASFGYFVILPLALRANVQYGAWLGFDVPQASFGFICFICRFVLGMGLALAIPVGLLALVRIGLLNHRKLTSLRRHIIVINLILGAVLTTPEVVTQIAMFIPLQLLCEASIWIASRWERNELKHA
jgi:Sec-independent protein translocase protein (TatC)